MQDRVYWTDREKEAVYSANRLTGQEVTSLAERLKDPHDIVVFHELSQPQGPAQSSIIISLIILIISTFTQQLYMISQTLEQKKPNKQELNVKNNIAEFLIKYLKAYIWFYWFWVFLMKFC